MKKFMTLMLGLSFIMGTVSMFAQEKKEEPKAETNKTEKKKSKKLKKGEKKTEEAKPTR